MPTNVQQNFDITGIYGIKKETDADFSASALVAGEGLEPPASGL